MPLPSFLLRSLMLCPVAIAGLLSPSLALAQTATAPRAPQVLVQSIPVPTPPITPEELQELTGGPTRVTWSGNLVPARDAIQALLDTANLTPFYRGMADEGLGSVSVSWQNTPFWKAAHDLELQVGGKWTSGNWGTLIFAPRDLRPLPIGTRVNTGEPDERLAAQTPFVTIRSASLSRAQTTQVRLGEELPAGPDSTELAMTAYFDPKLRVRSIGGLDAKVQAREHGPVLVPSWESTSFKFDFGSIVKFEKDLFGKRRPIALRPAARDILTPRFALVIPSEIAGGTRLYRVSGLLRAVVTSAPQAWIVPDLLATPQATRTLGKARYSVDGAEVKEDKLVLRLSATPPDSQLIPSIWDTLPGMYVSDAQGHLMRGFERTIYGPDKMQVEYTCSLTDGRGQALAGPYSLGWTISTEPRSLDVPFELHDVLVP